MAEKKIFTENTEISAAIFGGLDANAELIEKEYGVVLTENSDGDGLSVRISGENPDGVEKAASVVSALKKIAQVNGSVSQREVAYSISMINDGRQEELNFIDSSTVCLTSRGKPISAKTAGQKEYINAVKNNTVVFGVGPAGTGKTFLAVALAVKALRSKEVARIVITRPAVEAGERLGFLPGDLQSKIDPYLRPLYDALYEMLGADACQRYVERGTIEIAPLAYMRGRTLDDSFIILDEAQNTSPEQMKMFLTRLGNNSKAVITGDLTQTDLPAGMRSGLSEAVKILNGVEGIAIHRFTGRDVVRHRIVQKIINAYEKYEADRASGRNR
ncbi:MAG: PhoH family protein [Firmicutes bacterium]|nr:PhoH family protein [Candidatus Colimorpha enterica]